MPIFSVTTKFQFQKGSINTCVGVVALDVVLFQFQKGSINTQTCVDNGTQCPYFNSKKVRLIPLWANTWFAPLGISIPKRFD